MTRIDTTSVIYVPELGRRPLKNQSIQNLLKRIDARIQLYTYDYTFENQEIWPTLSRKGDELVGILKDQWEATVSMNGIWFVGLLTF